VLTCVLDQKPLNAFSIVSKGWTMKISMIAAIAALALASGTAHAATYVVSGQSDPFLAGASVGNSITWDTGDIDSAGPQSPTAIAVTAGETLTISYISGLVSNGSCCAAVGPTGGSPTGSDPFTATFTPLVTSFPTAFNLNSLLGLFNGSSPSIFEIGDGGTFVAPAGATELYLGTADTYQYNNNTGSFNVSVTGVPEPGTWAMMVVGLGIIGAGLRFSRRKNVLGIAAA
jgi:hypothetical protein